MVVGRNGHNSIDIRASALKPRACDREQNFDQNQAKTRHWAAKKIELSSIFWQPWSEFPLLFIIFLLKKGKKFNF